MASKKAAALLVFPVWVAWISYNNNYKSQHCCRRKSNRRLQHKHIQRYRSNKPAMAFPAQPAGSDRTGAELLSYFERLAAMIASIWSDTPIADRRAGSDML